MHKNMGALPANIQQAAKNREIESALNLIFGFELTLHLHIFERAALNFINAAILSVVFKLRQKYLFMRFLTPYLTVIILLAGTGI